MIDTDSMRAEAERRSQEKALLDQGQFRDNAGMTLHTPIRSTPPPFQAFISSRFSGSMTDYFSHYSA